MIIAIIITGILFVLGMIFKKSKSIYGLEFVWMWILLSFCNNLQRPDIVNYIKRYESIENYGVIINNSEIGYSLLSKVFSCMGLNFNSALMVMMFLVLLIIGISIPKYTEYISFVSSLFMLYPLFISGIQIRNSFAMAIIIYSVQFLKDDKKSSLLKFSLCIIIATCFHSSAIIYFALVLVKIINKKNLKYLIVFFIVLMWFIPKMDISILRNIFGEGRYENKFFSHTNTLFEFLIAMIWQLSCTVGVMYLQHSVNRRAEKKHEKLVAINELIVQINMALMIIIPLYYVDFSTERLYRNIIVLNYIFIANCIEIVKCEKKLNLILIYICMTIWFLLTTIFFEGIYDNRWKEVMSVYLNENNMLVNWKKYLFQWLYLLVFGSIFVNLNRLKVRFVLRKNKK